MSGLLALGSPLVLLGLAALPVIWWLLRVTPPRPDVETFPPLKILAKVLKSEVTPRKMPWWLLLLRLCLAAAVILALAEPILNPSTRLSSGSGPLAIVIDNGWPSQRIAEAQARTALALVSEAERDGRMIHIAATVQPANADTGPFDPDAARKVLAAIAPQPAPPLRAAALARLSRSLGAGSGATLAFLSDGVAQAADDAAFKSLETGGLESLQWFAPTQKSFAAIAGVTNQPDALDIEVASFGPAARLALAAYDGKGRRIGEAELQPSGQTGHARLEAPYELRNDIQSVSIDGQHLAAATFALDDNLKRRRVALLSGSEADQAQPLLSPLYYIRKAVEPFADIVVPKNADIATGLAEVLETKPSVIVMADIGSIPAPSVQPLKDYLERGGMLIRFAGPRLAAAEQDEFLPVALRKGERALGGSMSWTQPQPLAPFPPESPFAALAAPKDITVSRQVLAEPDADLATRTWAILSDGTPLVTAASRGKGRIVLFHVAPQATWSNLPISGTFVDMLRQTIQLASGSGGAAKTGLASLKPWRIISADGVLGAPPAEAKPLTVGAAVRPAVTLENPPGLYGGDEGAEALNILSPGAALAGATTPQLALTVETRAYLSGETRSLKGILLGLAAALFLADSLVMLWMNRRPALARAALAALLLFSAGPILDAPRAFAQDSDARPGDTDIVDAISVTRLAFIKSGNADTDNTTLEGLKGLTLYLIDKTSLEPADPVGLDPETDELSFYPMLYWPIDADAPMPSDKAIARVDAYMQGGGSVLFDTRDQGGSSFSLSNGASPATQRLRDILANMSVPPLEPAPDDHVLTKSFYLLKNFPGRYDGSPLWVEQSLDTVSRSDRPVRTGDGVSPILITGNDLAAAWALNDNGEPLYPTVPDNPEQRVMALRAGVNIMMYMLTGNYKSDQVHIPSLLERLGQ